MKHLAIFKILFGKQPLKNELNGISNIMNCDQTLIDNLDFDEINKCKLIIINFQDQIRANISYYDNPVRYLKLDNF